MTTRLCQSFSSKVTKNLDNLERELVTLEGHPDDIKALGNIFRMIHTTKGTCGFLGFGKLEKVARARENANLRNLVARLKS